MAFIAKYYFYQFTFELYHCHYSIKFLKNIIFLSTLYIILYEILKKSLIIFQFIYLCTMSCFKASIFMMAILSESEFRSKCHEAATSARALGCRCSLGAPSTFPGSA